MAGSSTSTAATPLSFYDLNTDPGEMRNLVRSAAHADRVKRLTKQLRAWQARHRDTIPLAA